MIVVPVFITSCQVSLNENIGPVTTHIAIMATASAKVLGRPQKCEADFAKPEYQLVVGMAVVLLTPNVRVNRLAEASAVSPG